MNPWMLRVRVKVQGLGLSVGYISFHVFWEEAYGLGFKTFGCSLGSLFASRL